MRTLFSAAAALPLCLGLVATPAAAKDGENAAAALVILGAAALMHNDHNYREDWRPRTDRETADFERGYRDGLHNANYNMRHDGRAYSEGYSSGQKERDNRLAYDRNHGSSKPPHAAKQGCIGEVAGSLNVGRHDVHIVGSRPTNHGSWKIETAVGHKHLVCDANEGGGILGLQNGRL